MNILAVTGGNGVIVHPLKEYLIANLEPRAIFHSPGEQQWFENFSAPLLKESWEVKKIINRVDCIIGAPDCGHSSMLALSRGKKMTDPLQNTSLMMFIEMCQYYKPNIWFMENLPAMLKNVTMEWFTELFQDYTFGLLEGPVTHFGNSQATRKRLVMVAVRNDYNYKKDILQRANISPIKNIKTVQELLKDLPENGNVREDMDKYISMYSGKKTRIKVSRAQRIWNGRLKGKRRNEVNRDKMKNQPGVYRNLNKCLPLTVTKSDRQFNPEGLPMSPRELARIQGVPDNFKIYIDDNNKQYWINKGRATFGKSAPYEIAEWFKFVLGI